MRQVGSILQNTNTDDLVERITIFYHDTVQDSEGNPIPDGEEKIRCRCWAKIYPYAARITDGYNERVNETCYRVVIRYREGITVNDKILWRGKRLSMTAPPYDAENRRIWLVMECRELWENGQT